MEITKGTNSNTQAEKQTCRRCLKRDDCHWRIVVVRDLMDLAKRQERHESFLAFDKALCESLPAICHGFVPEEDG